MQPVATELLRDLGGILRNLGVRWYVFGAQVVVVHGFVRQTAGVDVTVELPPDGLAACKRGKLDLAAVRARLAVLEPLLDRSDLLPQLEQLLARLPPER